MKKTWLITIFVYFLCSCATPNTSAPSSVNLLYPLGTIGQEEPVFVPPFANAFASRIDTGAAISSIDAKNIQVFERDGKKWVSFDIKQRNTDIAHHFETPLVRKSSVKRIKEDEDRYIINLPIKMGELNIDAQFSLADREKFDYQVLIGRNILIGNAIINPALSNTLK